MDVFNPKLYAWAPINPSTWRRRPLASEGLWLQRPYSDRSLYVSGTFALTEPKPIRELERIVKFSWSRLRWLHPEVGLRANLEERMLEYIVPANNDEILQWLEKTVKVAPRLLQQMHGGIGLGEIIEKVERLWKGNSTELDQTTYLCFLTDHPQEDEETVEKVEFLFRFDHLCTDGIGARILAGKFFLLFAEFMNGSGEARSKLERMHNWHSSIQNLTPSWTEIMNEEQAVEGVDFEEAVRQQEKLLLEETPNNLGLQFSRTSDKPSSRHGFYHYTISRSNSTALINAIKNELPRGTTVTHLAHAAMVLAILRANAASSVDSPAKDERPPQPAISFHSPCFLSARRCIQPTDTCKLPAQQYIPICQGLGEVAFADLSSYTVSSNSPPSTVLETLLHACSEATKSYLAIKSRKSILTESLPLMHKLSEQMAASKHSNKQPEEEHVLVQSDPYLLSDGITENYITHAHSSFTFQSLHFAAAPSSSNLIIRLSSWGDEITVGAEWKPHLYDRNMVEDFVADIVAMMLLVCGS